MKLTETTLQTLKNFASINPNIVVENGSKLKTISESKTVLASSTVEETFPVEFGIYDLNEFLSVLSLVDDPDVEFSENFMSIRDGVGRSNTKYFYSDKAILTTPSKEIIMPESEVKFTLDKATLSKIRRASSVLAHNELEVTANDGSVSLSIKDSNDATSNVFTIDVDGSYDSDNFKFVFDVNNLKMIDGDYSVSVSSKLISHFVNNNTKVEYWCALEKQSTYGE